MSLGNLAPDGAMVTWLGGGIVRTYKVTLFPSVAQHSVFTPQHLSRFTESQGISRTK
jgi:hypothetical protein